MKENITAYVNDLFKDQHQIEELIDLKEELVADLTDKVTELIAQGKSEEEAFEEAKHEIGDLNELIESLSHVTRNRVQECIKEWKYHRNSDIKLHLKFARNQCGYTHVLKAFWTIVIMLFLGSGIFYAWSAAWYFLLFAIVVRILMVGMWYKRFWKRDKL